MNKRVIYCKMLIIRRVSGGGYVYIGVACTTIKATHYVVFIKLPSGDL